MRRVFFSEEALRHYTRLRKTDRTFVKEGIREHLALADPAQTSRNKFRLRRASEFAEFELRLERWRVFYRLNEDRVEVTMIGEKKRNQLLIAGEVFPL